MNLTQNTTPSSFHVFWGIVTGNTFEKGTRSFLANGRGKWVNFEKTFYNAPENLSIPLTQRDHTLSEGPKLDHQGEPNL